LTNSGLWPYKTQDFVEEHFAARKSRTIYIRNSVKNKNKIKYSIGLLKEELKVL